MRRCLSNYPLLHSLRGLPQAVPRSGSSSSACLSLSSCGRNPPKRPGSLSPSPSSFSDGSLDSLDISDWERVASHLVSQVFRTSWDMSCVQVADYGFRSPGGTVCSNMQQG